MQYVMVNLLSTWLVLEESRGRGTSGQTFGSASTVGDLPLWAVPFPGLGPWTTPIKEEMGWAEPALFFASDGGCHVTSCQGSCCLNLPTVVGCNLELWAEVNFLWSPFFQDALSQRQEKKLRPSLIRKPGRAKSLEGELTCVCCQELDAKAT